jgi:hypothetical protein
MASRPLTPAFGAFDLTTEWQVLYTPPGDTLRAGIDALVFNNYTSTNQTFSLRIFEEGAVTVLNEIITEKGIRSLSNDLAAAAIGQAIIAGGTLQAKASANSSISATGTVTEIIS